MTTVAPWTDDPQVLAAHRLDRSGYDPGGTPRAVVHAESAADVAEVLRAAHADGTPVLDFDLRCRIRGGPTRHILRRCRGGARRRRWGDPDHG